MTGDPQARLDVPARIGPLGLALLFGALAIGAYWRVVGLGDAVLYGDEYHSLKTSTQDYGTILRTYDFLGSHVPLPFLQRLFQDVFGENLWSYRMPAIIPGILTLLLFYPLARRWIGAAPALVATLALALSPIHIFYSRFARSYALIVLLALLLVVCLERALRENDGSREDVGRRWPWRAGAIACAALLPYVHLSSLGFVAGVGGAALVRRSSGASRAVAVGLFLAGGAIFALLSLPVLEPMFEFLSKLPKGNKDQPVSLLGVPALLAGAHWFGAAWLVLVPVAMLAFLRERRDVAMWFVGAILGPLVFLLATRPHGMAYAWSRYLLTSLPFVLMVLSWGLVALVRRAAGSREAGSPEAGSRLGAALGIGLVLVLYFSGPTRPGLSDDGPYENVYLRMHTLPAFDVPFTGTPSFYEALARMPEDTRVIEAPSLHSRALLLYRNYYLQHGRETLMGRAGGEETLISGPYAWLSSPTLADDDRADYLILHRNLPLEVADYFRFVYDDIWPLARNAASEPFMIRHEKYFLSSPSSFSVASDTNDRLRASVGAPIYEDPYISVWKLSPGKGPKRGRKGERRQQGEKGGKRGG